MKQNETRNKIVYCAPMGNCIPQETIIRDVRLAAAYVPYQKLCTIFSPMEALKRGTVFPELYSPYQGEDKNVAHLHRTKGGESYDE